MAGMDEGKRLRHLQPQFYLFGSRELQEQASHTLYHLIQGQGLFCGMEDQPFDLRLNQVLKSFS